MRARLPHSEIRTTNGLAGRVRRDACAADPIVTAGVPTLSPRIPASDQRQEGQPAHPVAAPSDLGLAMQPFDLTQCAYAVETVMPALREQDEAHQALVVMVGPSAVITARQAKAFHVAISNVAVLGELAERLALYPDLLTVLQHLERGDSVRIVVTANSCGTVTEFVGGGDVVAFAPIERVA
ncbi:hypothetical protein MKK64_17340 [Methylobacterium sp. E-025]|uniref:hypothetical protein n=1 Tax=Methylobacterium sp. E-025 TaxID=2836561 RepID=UPI001FB93E3C|nr:hypothetical protein [Methylobacterium sp. E-025]MCJ2112948.1 hypothetical protein [Methylobacterium sp. E-025]